MSIKSFHLGKFDVTYFQELNEYGEEMMRDLLLRISSQYEIKYDQSVEILTTMIASLTNLKVVFVVTLEERNGDIYVIERWRAGKEKPYDDPIIEFEIPINVNEVSVEYLESKMTKTTVPKKHKSIVYMTASVPFNVFEKSQSSYIRLRNRGFHLRRMIQYHANALMQISEVPYWLECCHCKFRGLAINVVKHFYKLEATPIVNKYFTSIYDWLMNKLANKSSIKIIPSNPKYGSTYVEDKSGKTKSILK